MRHDTHSRTTGEKRHPDESHLARLDDLRGYKVASGDPDVRGWSVKTADGQRAGKVDSLVIDTDAMQVRYLDVELDRDTLGLNDRRHVLLPIATARLDDDHDDVLLGSMTATDVASLQPYRSGDPIAPGPAPVTHADDHRQFYGTRGGTGAVQRVELTDEEMALVQRARQERARQAGEADVRRPAETAGDEVRIPLTGAEEVVIEKRAVPTEEVVIRKKAERDEPADGRNDPRH